MLLASYFVICSLTGHIENIDQTFVNTYIIAMLAPLKEGWSFNLIERTGSFIIAILSPAQIQLSFGLAGLRLVLFPLNPATHIPINPSISFNAAIHWLYKPLLND